MSPRKPKIRSLVVYRWCAPIQDHRYDTPNEGVIDDMLKKAQDDGLVRNFDTGRGLLVWFEGPAGKRLRALRDKVRGLLPEDWVNDLR